MPNYIRSRTAGATYFFTVTLADRRAAWLTDHIDLLREAVVSVKRLHPFGIDAMVVLPEHIHALWTLPRDDADYPMRWRLVKLQFSRAFRRQAWVPAVDVWQPRYWEHQVRDDDDYARHVDYIHFNPVKHGWARRAADWPHSSFHAWVRQGRLPADWGTAAAASIGNFGE